MERIEKSRSKLELLMIAIFGGCAIYYSAILLVHFGLWLDRTYATTKADFKAWVYTWDSGPIQITLEESGKNGGIVLANGKEVKDYENAIDYLFIQSQEFARCKARLEEIRDLSLKG